MFSGTDLIGLADEEHPDGCLLKHYIICEYEDKKPLLSIEPLQATLGDKLTLTISDDFGRVGYRIQKQRFGNSDWVDVTDTDLSKIDTRAGGDIDSITYTIVDWDVNTGGTSEETPLKFRAKFANSTDAYYSDTKTVAVNTIPRFNPTQDDV